MKQRRGWGEQLIPNKPIPYFILQSSINRYAWATQFAKERTILDAACGSGYGSNYLREQGARMVIGGDASQEAIEYATKHYAKDGLEFRLLDVQKLPFPDKYFDAIVSFETIEHLPRIEDFFSECRRVLKDNGMLICSTPNTRTASPDSKPKARYHVRELYPEEFAALLAKHFKEITLYGMDPQKPADKNIYRLATRLEPIIFYIPKVHILVNLVTRFVFRRYRLVKLAEMDEIHLSGILDKSYWPFLLKDSSVVPGDIIAVAR